jgi:hypothetical protein
MFVGIGMNLVRGGTSSSPASLFAASEPGVWYDPSDITTLFTDSAGTTPVTGPNQPVGKILDKSGRGNHATQSTDAYRPTYGINPITGTRNLYTYTEQFDNAIWGKTAGPVTVAADVITAPNSTTTADKVQETTATADFFALSRNPQGFLFSSSYTWSGYFKAAERSFISVNFSGVGVVFFFNLTTGAFQVTSGTATLTSTDVGNGWWRCTATFTTPASGINLLYHIICSALSLTTIVTTGTAGYGFYIWGAQLEQSATATAYQKVVSQYEVTEAGVQSASYLAFDGFDDSMVTGTITPGIDKAQVFAGVRKLSDAAAGIMMELSTNVNNFNGTVVLAAPHSSGSNSYGMASRGTLIDNPSESGYPAPNTAVLSALSDIAAPSAILRVNRTTNFPSTTSQGTGNFLAYPLYIGRRGGTTLPYNGRIYSLITRFGANLTDGQITATESWVNSKTGAY